MRLGIYGAGGFGREVYWLLRSILDAQVGIDPTFQVVTFLDDTRTGTVAGLPVQSLHESLRSELDGIVLAVGVPAIRRQIADRLLSNGWVLCGAVSPNMLADSSNTIGEFAVICSGTILTVDVAMGRGVQINLACTIGHNVTIGDFCTLAPGVHVSGYVTIEPDVFIGTGAVIVNGTAERPLTIGAGAVIGAGACVIRDVPAGVTVGGVPAGLLR